MSHLPNIHSTKACPHTTKFCAKYFKNHSDKCTATTLKCTNCVGVYVATNKPCPHYLQEFKIQKFKSQCHLTIIEAHCLYTDTENKKEIAFISVASYKQTRILVKPDYITKDNLNTTMMDFAIKVSGMFKKS